MLVDQAKLLMNELNRFEIFKEISDWWGFFFIDFYLINEWQIIFEGI
jgi:hypothetical protein